MLVKTERWFNKRTGSTSIAITKDAEIKFPLTQDVKLYAENYSTVGIIKSSGNFMAMGEIQNR